MLGKSFLEGNDKDTEKSLLTIHDINENKALIQHRNGLAKHTHIIFKLTIISIQSPENLESIIKQQMSESISTTFAPIIQEQSDTFIGQKILTSQQYKLTPII